MNSDPYTKMSDGLILPYGNLSLNILKKLEAATGFEPVNNGFADRRLTTWLCRLSTLESLLGIPVRFMQSQYSVCALVGAASAATYPDDD